MEMPISKIIFGAILSSSVFAALVSFLLKRRSERMTHEVKEMFEERNQSIIHQVKNQFEEKLTFFKSNYTWKEKTLSELLGPLYLLFKRTSDAIDRYNSQNIFLEAKILKESNERIRNMLIEKAYLIPVDILPEAQQLIEHFDRWLEEFDQLRGENKEVKLEDKFVFVGPKGYPFPKEAERKFLQRYKKIWIELYGENS